MMALRARQPPVPWHADGGQKLTSRHFGLFHPHRFGGFVSGNLQIAKLPKAKLIVYISLAPMPLASLGVYWLALLCSSRE
jgi:hypothetical protein